MIDPILAATAIGALCVLALAVLATKAKRQR
jgi:hypothetical protein